MAVGWREQYTRYRGFFLNIMDLYKKRADLRAFFEVILSLGTILVFIVFALKPTILTIIALTQQIREKEETVAKLEEKNRNLDVANDLLLQNQGRIQDVNTAVGTSPNPEVVAKQIQGIAQRNSTQVLGVSFGQAAIVGEDPTARTNPDEKPIEGAGGEMTLSISARGSYESLKNFIRDVENMRVIVKLDSVTINSAVTEEGQLIVGVISGRVPFTNQKQ